MKPFAPLLFALALAGTASAVDSAPEGLCAADWSSIRKAYEAVRHAATRQKDGTLGARNPGQRWLTRFDGRGFTVAPNAGSWTWGLALQRYGFPGAERNVGDQAAMSHRGGEIHYDWDDSLREWFVNDQRGLQQGWTIKERPPESREGQPFRLELAVRGGLQPAVAANGTDVSFQNAEGSQVLNFTGLKAWDADGQALTARFETTAPGSGAGVVRIAVDESGARYPITVDPIAQQAYLKASNAQEGDWFGESVAVSGDTVVVGARRESGNGTGGEADNSASQAGAAYVFVREGTTWSQQAYLKASNAQEGDWFGFSVAVSGDTVVVGAFNEDSNGTGGAADNSASQAGAAYVFVRNGTVWSQEAYLKASNAEAGDYFGLSVAVSGDTVVVGAHGEDSHRTGGEADNNATNAGAAYVFVREGNAWSQQAYLKASNAEAGDLFGYSVAVSGDTIVVGAYYEDSNGTGGEPDNSASQAGAAYVFVRNGTVWSQEAYLKASNAEADDIFGWVVSVSGDTVVVGAHGEDSNGTGGEADNSASQAGAGYVFVRNGTVWSQEAYLKASNAEAWDDFGYSVAVSGDTIVVGAYCEDGNGTGGEADNNAGEAGAAYVFVRAGITWSQRAYLKASNPEAVDNFGQSVAVSGGSVVVGASGEDGNGTGGETNNSASAAGAAYVFRMAPLPAEIVVEQASAWEIVDGATTDFGGVPVNESKSVTYTIRNLGEEDLTGLTITKDGTNAGDFAVRAGPVAPVAQDASATFTIEFTPTSGGVRTAAIHIQNNDEDESPFDITLTGRGLTTAEDTDGDGLNDVGEFKLAPLGFDWEADNSALVATLMGNASVIGLHTEAEIRNVYAGAPLLQVTGGTVTLELQLLKSDDLVNWESFGNPVQWTEAAGDKAFYRLFFTEPARQAR